MQTSAGGGHGAGDVDAAAEDAVASNNIRSRWALLRNKNNDDMVKLDVDLLEDLVEATGNLIHDREARAALEVLPTNQLGKHKMGDVIKWWVSRQEARRKPPTKPWRRRLANLMDIVNRPWKFLEFLKDETNTQVQINKIEENWADWKTEEDLALEKELEDEREYQRLKAEREAKRDGLQVAGADGANAAPPSVAPSLFASNSTPGVTVKAWESDSEEEGEEERNCKLACRLAIGHVKEKKASIKFDIAASNITTSTPNPITAPPATPSNPLAPTPFSPTRPPASGNGAPGSPSRPRSRGQTAASHIRLYARDILNSVFQTAGVEWNLKNEQSAASGGYKSVAWVDIPVKAEAKEELVNKVVNQLVMFLDSVPKDYAHPVYTSSKVELVTLSSRDPKPYIRITLLNERDPFEEVEKFLPPEIKIKDAIDNLSLHLDLNVSLNDIMALTKQFAGYKEKLYGPQEDELGEVRMAKGGQDIIYFYLDLFARRLPQLTQPLPRLISLAPSQKGMDPAIFMNSVKQRRKAALRASRMARNKDMPLSDMKKHLASRGMSTEGTINEIRERTEQLFAIQAEIVGYGELSNFGEDISKAIFKRVDRDNDGALNFWEMNTLQRCLGGVAQEYPARYEEAVAESGFAVNKDGWLTSDGLTAYYERFGQLAKDVEDIGVGSLDDYVCANISLTGEIRSKIIQGIDKIFDGAREAQYNLKFTNFISRFVKDYYLDWECKRLSDLFIKEEVPKFFKAPGGPANLVLEYQRLVADGRRGYIPEFREGVERALGKGWGWSTPGEWDIVSEEEETRKKAEAERAKVERISKVGKDKGIDLESYQIETLDGWESFKLADGSKPLWLREALSKFSDEEKREEEVMEANRVKYSETSFVPKGTIESIAQLKSDLDGVRAALSRPLPRRQREELQEIETSKATELQELDTLLERGLLISCHHSLKCYDALRAVCTGIHSVNWGNRAFTSRLESEGFDFFHLLPPGVHESATLSEAMSAKEARAVERKRDAKKFIVEERKRTVMEAKERERLKKELADKKIKERAEEETSLFTRGAEARVRGYNKKNDQAKCIEFWRRLYLLFENRYDQMDANRNILAVSVAANNLGVVCFEFGDGQIAPTKESLQRLRKANEYIDDVLRKLKAEAKQRNLERIAEEKKRLKAEAQARMREKIVREQALKGAKMVKKGDGDDNSFMAQRKSKLFDDANREARKAQKAAEEAEEMERQLLKEFADSDDEEVVEEQKSGDANPSQEEQEEQEEEKKRTQSDEEFGDDFDPSEAKDAVVNMNKLMEERRKKKLEAGKAAEKNVFGGKQRTTLIPTNIASKVNIPEDVALAAAIVKFNLVTIMNEIGAPVDEDDNDERQHLQFDCYNLFHSFVGKDTKEKPVGTIGDSVQIKNVGVARIDTFPPEDFETWKIRVTQADIEREKAEKERQNEELRKRKEAREKKRQEKAERRKKKEAKKYKKLQREFKDKELEALTKGEEIDLDVLEMVNPKKAAKIRDRQRRMEEMLERRRIIEEERAERARQEQREKDKQAAKLRREQVKKQAVEDEVAEILEEDQKLRSGLNGIISGFRWTAKPDPDKLRKEITEREEALRQEAKEMKKRLKEAEREKEMKRRAREERRAKRAKDGLSESSSESDSVKSDLTDDDDDDDEMKDKGKGKGRDNQKQGRKQGSVLVSMGGKLGGGLKLLGKGKGSPGADSSQGSGEDDGSKGSKRRGSMFGAISPSFGGFGRKSPSPSKSEGESPKKNFFK